MLRILANSEYKIPGVTVFIIEDGDGCPHEETLKRISTVMTFCIVCPKLHTVAESWIEEGL